MRYIGVNIISVLLLLVGCTTYTTEKRTVYAVPVYGQSLALGEEAEIVTDFDSLSEMSNHRIVTENLNEKFGFFADTRFKQWMKSIINYKHRVFELSIYGVAESIVSKWKSEGVADSLMLCIFPGGQGSSGIMELGKGSQPYIKFLSELKDAYNKSQSKGWDFVVPTVCWMQGEDDIVWRKVDNYKRRLKLFQEDINRDIKAITKQKRDVVLICYQTNCLTLSKQFNANAFECWEMKVPQAQMELVRDDSLFMASGPLYPYSFKRERVHIDGISQKRLGYLAGISLYRLLKGQPSKGVLPTHIEVKQNTIVVNFNVPHPPLVIDTVLVKDVKNKGFSVIDSMRTDILNNISLSGTQVFLHCNKSPIGCKVRYAVNGLKEKSGFKDGPRGNLRDSQGNIEVATILGKKYPLHNWCYQFEFILEQDLYQKQASLFVR